MSNHVFVYREKDSISRDACKYLEVDEHSKQFYVSGPNFFGGDWPSYDKIETILTEDEYTLILQTVNMEVEKTEENVNLIYNKLTSIEAQKFFENIIKDEKKRVLQEWDLLTEDDVEEIFGLYPLDYKDRGIVGCVWGNAEEMGEDEAENLGYVGNNSVASRYFDYEMFGQDLINEDEVYYELSSGTVVRFNL